MADDKKKSYVNPEVDKVIKIPKSWYQQPHRKKIKFFMPENDDRIDPGFIFDGYRTPHGCSSHWNNTVYAHQLYDTPNYDGILVSRNNAENGSHKREMTNNLGIHRFLRVPREFTVFGDCGAWEYHKEEVPTYTTDEMLDYYSRLDYDYGVSLDHLIKDKKDKVKREFRYKLTIDNAKEFIEGHKKMKCKWVPVGAIQGWDPESYSKAAKKMVEMGYHSIALGGMVYQNPNFILEVLKAVRGSIPVNIDIHLFGVTRLDLIPIFVKYGITSIDSSTHLQKSFKDYNKNFLTQEDKNNFTRERWYRAIRIQRTGREKNSKIPRQIAVLIDAGIISLGEVQRLEKDCLDGMRQYAKSTAPPNKKLIKKITYIDMLNSSGSTFDNKNKPRKIKKGVEKFKEILMDIDSDSSININSWYFKFFKKNNEETFQKKRKERISGDYLSENELESLESICFKGINQYLKNKQKINEPSYYLAHRIFEYDHIMSGKKGKIEEKIHETLIDRPWQDETCNICKDIGIEAIIFHGNNRNRLRGFHNVFVFYRMFREYVNNYKKYLEKQNI